MTKTSEVQFQLRGRCNIYVGAPRFPPVAILNSRVIKADLHHVGSVPVHVVRRGSEKKLVEPESVPHRCHIEGEGMMTVCDVGLAFTKFPVVQPVPHTERSVTDADAIYETFPFGIPHRPVACTVDDGNLSEICRAEDRDICSCMDIGLSG